MLTTRPDSSGVSTRTTLQPDGTRQVETYTHGLLTASEKKDTANAVLTGKSLSYNAFQWVSGVTDLRTGTTTYSNFTEAGQPLTTTDPGSRVTTVAKDIMGRDIATTLPDASVKYTAYYPTGQVKVTWGSQTYPTWNVYDEQGRQTQLHTWKTAPTLSPGALPTTIPAGSDVTTWIYGSSSGLLTRKQYADSKGTDYTYTLAGRLASRVWARGVTTTYSYDQGLLVLTDYSDATPDVSVTYDALGRQATVTQSNQSQISYTYDPANLALDTETIRYDLDHNGTYDFTRVLDRSRDALQRDSGYTLQGSAGVPPASFIETQATYQYSATTGRLLNVVGGGDIASPQTFTYAYTPNSDLIQSVTGPAHTAINAWDPYRDVLASKQNKVGSTVVSQYEYVINSIGQRSSVATSGSAFSAAAGWAWGYDSLGQVVSADSTVSGFDRAYQYDAIGNRLFSEIANTQISDPPLASTTGYASNSLNQYTSIQKGSTGVSPVYDHDGNATAYPLPVAPTADSAMAWDGENRMITTTVGTTTTTYLYDAQSRRIAKTTGSVTTLYVYDAWNCIAEYSSTNAESPISHVRSLLWGTDLSGSMQGAGGVGGLLLITDHSALITHHLPTYDGNGNVCEYLSESGTIAAHYEYNPFGNILVATGPKAADFSYRFSTKPQDSETGLYYYGYRYYDPMTGRWPSRDSIEEKGGLHLYAIIRNSTVNKIDVLGKASFDLPDWIWYLPLDGERREKNVPQSGGGDFRHCFESCRLGRRVGPANAAILIEGWNKMYEDPTSRPSRRDILANWCGLAQSFKLTQSCEEACKCNCLERKPGDL